MSFRVSMGLAWLWEACLLMLRVVFLLCWRISMVCLALQLVGSWVGLYFSVDIEIFISVRAEQGNREGFQHLEGEVSLGDYGPGVPV